MATTLVQTWLALFNPPLDLFFGFTPFLWGQKSCLPGLAISQAAPALLIPVEGIFLGQVDQKILYLAAQPLNLPIPTLTYPEFSAVKSSWNE